MAEPISVNDGMMSRLASNPEQRAALQIACYNTLLFVLVSCLFLREKAGKFKYYSRKAPFGRKKRRLTQFQPVFGQQVAIFRFLRSK